MAENFLKNVSSIKYWTDSFSKIEKSLEDLEVLMDFVKEDPSLEGETDQHYIQLEKMIEDLELRKMLGGEEIIWGYSKN